ncbi:MAG TPA: hypothetical protein VHZ78_01150 [Rhizomicrobium sp.]|jgi:hypothetical protein|nr:hypothetical protein [Rhizomicrobium sp.]
MTWERVYTVNDYHDCPRFGVADFEGVPHIYESWFDETADDYTREFRLVRIAPDLLALVLEDWQLWLRWRRAYLAGEVPAAQEHPALPADRERRDQLRALIADRFTARTEGAVKMHARFRGKDENREVEWLPVPPISS